LIVLILVLAALSGTSLATSPITTTGSINPGYGFADPWAIGGDLSVGYHGPGTLSVAGEGAVTTGGTVFLGSPDPEYNTATGHLTITGLGSSFGVDPAGESELFIGPLAEGQLTLTNQATLSSHDTTIGGSPVLNESDEVIGVAEGIGYATVSGGAQWSTGEWGWLTVGAAGQGELAITGAGSAVETDTSELGLMPGSTGDVLVDDSGSWSVTQNLVVGVWGQGALTVSGGGQVESGAGWVGGVDAATMDYNEPIFDGLGEPNGTGNVVVTGNGSQWDAGSMLNVGSWGVGGVRIEEGGRVVAEQVFIGGMPITLAEDQDFSWDLMPDGTGTITVTGEGSTLEVTSPDTLYVGYSGTGVLDVNEGGLVNSNGVIIGGAPGSTGTVTLHDEDTQLITSEEILVGAWGDGYLTISEGATAQTEWFTVGGFDANDSELDPEILAAFGDADGTGAVVITGDGSSLDVSDEAYVGNYGTGIVDVNDGATVDTSQTVLGVAPGSYGQITVDGAGSSWNVSTDVDFETDTGLFSGVMAVGAYGEGLLTVSGGGNVTVDDVIFVGGYPTEELGFDSNAVGYEPNGIGTITVTGSGSTLVTDGIHVGDSGQGTLNVLNAGRVSDEVALVGVGRDSVGEVLVNGAGSLWENASGAFVGGYGEGNVTVSGGGHATFGEVLYIGGFDPNAFSFDTTPYGGGDPNGTGAVTVTGTGSLVQAFAIGVGAVGNGTLNILNGARVESQIGGVGVGESSVGLVTVDGAGSTWQISGDANPPGEWAVAGEGDLIVSNGGLVDVNDPNAILAVGDTITVGSEGQGTLTINNGATVASADAILGGTNPEFENLEDYFDPNAGLGAGTGTAVVSGAGSTWETGNMYVGFSGTGNLTISNGGAVVGESGWIGLMPDAHGTALVTGEDSTWTNEDAIVVGGWGQGDLTIAAGGVVTAPEVYIGGMPFDLVGADYDPNLMPTGTGAVLVTGAGSELDITSDNTLYVGYSGTGTLDVNDGGAVDAPSVVIGATPDSIGTVDVRGTGSTLTTEDIQVGAWGTGDLTVADGASATTSYLAVGGFDVNDTSLPQEVLDDFGASHGTGTATVTGAGSSLETETFLAGVTGEGTIQVAAGGQLTAELGVVGLGEGSTGTVTVAGENSTLTLEAVIEEGLGYGVLAVGGWGTGQMTISGGGLVDANRVYIGGFDPNELTDREGDESDWGDGYPAGSGTVLVMGEGSQLISSGDQPLYVGYSGVGILTASQGGQIVTDTMTIGSGPDATGTVTIDGGELTAASDVIVGAWGQGNLTVSHGGQAEVGALVVGGFDANDAPEGLVEALGDPNGSGTVAVRDANSILEVTGDDGIQVGYSGTGALEVLDGAEVRSHVAIIGVTEDGVGAVTVDDALLRITGDQASDLTADGEGSLTITNDGMVLVEDANALLDVAGTILVGAEGESALAAMAVTNGGQVFSDTAALGLTAGSEGEVLVGDSQMQAFTLLLGPDPNTPSVWENSGALVVGGYGEGLLTISGDGEVYSDEVYIGGFDPGAGLFDIEDPGYDPNGAGLVMVDGDGALLDAGLLVVGTTGEGELDIAEGGQVNSQDALIGFGPDSAGYVFVDGADSTWTLYDPNELEEDWSILGVGVYGHGEMLISGGGQVNVADVMIGGFAMDAIDASDYVDLWGDPNGAGFITVTDEGSLLNVGYDLCVGHSGAGTLSILDGAHVVALDGYIGDEPNGVGTVTVSGDSSQLTLSDDLYVGGYGTGTLTISDGGLVVVDDAVHIGYGASGVGNALVTGAGSTWEIGENLYVGGNNDAAGGIGNLYVSDGGLVSVFDEMYVWETGLVGGDGTIDVTTPTTLHNYGTIAPGVDGIGTLTVDGSVVFYEGSTFAVDINNVTSDRLAVDGDVTIQGGTVQVSSSGTILGEHEYEILTGDTIVGEFNDLDTALLSFSVSEATLDYNEASVWLHVTAANFNDPNIAHTDNQRALGGALQGIGGQGGNDVTDAVQDIETADGVRGAYDQLAGQSRPPLAPMTVAGSSKFLGTVTSRLQNIQSGLVAGAFDMGLTAAAGPDQVASSSPAQEAATRGQNFAVGNGTRTLAGKRWGVWGRGYGLYGDRDSEGGVPSYSYNVYGGTFGVDYQFTDNFLAGIVGGLSEGDVDFGSSRDNTDFDAAHFGLYGSFSRGPWYVDSIVTVANLDYETERFVDLLNERLTGSFGGSEFAAYVEASRRFELNPKLCLAPLASLQYTHLNLDSYTETGGVSALAFDEQSQDSIRGSLGARLTQRLIESSGDFNADLQLRGRWAHEFGDNRSSVESSFASDPTVIFTVRDAETARDSAILGAGLAAQVSERTKLYLDYDARLNSDETVQVISAALQYRW
jgi:T5SS/PEP-CTERM-associated repeat protein